MAEVDKPLYAVMSTSAEEEEYYDEEYNEEEDVSQYGNRVYNSDLEKGIYASDAEENCSDVYIDDSTDFAAKATYFLVHNVIGLLLNLGLGFWFAKLLIGNVNWVIEGRWSATDHLRVEGLLSFRYLGAVIYFFLSALLPSYITGTRNSEAPLIISTVMQLYYNVFDGSQETVWWSLGAISLLIVCLVRRQRLIRIFFNCYNTYNCEFVVILKRDWKAIQSFFAEI